MPGRRPSQPCLQVSKFRELPTLVLSQDIGKPRTLGSGVSVWVSCQGLGKVVFSQVGAGVTRLGRPGVGVVGTRP